ncbi:MULTISPECIES: type II toxin-antitoxin system RelE/ParE family toxin [Hyphobacterium]|uniref:Type II toxin-antitoxin system RelE/ParE family toxin n=1 Tax=Hyphobacterium vulgare TaxID=1736751 RepID=A0ABV7A0J5_9PROT
MRIEFPSCAADDLVRLYLEGIERFGPAQAELYSQSFAAAFDRLVRFPHAGGQLDGIRLPTRHLIHNAHAIFYEVRGESILILRVLHGRMLPDDNL